LFRLFPEPFLTSFWDEIYVAFPSKIMLKGMSLETLLGPKVVSISGFSGRDV
jgi:hypothetical protein